MQFEFKLGSASRTASGEFIALRNQVVPLALVRNGKARRYVLRLRPDGSARVTIPRGGSMTEGCAFAQRNTEWLERALQRLASRPAISRDWNIGSEILFRGELTRIETGESGTVRCGTENVRMRDPRANVRDTLERHFWKLAAKELPELVLELAARHELTVRRVSVRNQRSRWGSCSRRGTISLNWRIIQAPPHVRDYLILHELMHLRQMNHSSRFWREVESVCPQFQAAERWLKQHSDLLQ